MTTEDFSGFGLAEPLISALQKAKFTEPTPIQQQAIPAQLEGRDILGVAQTGTGKTAAFGLPILHHILGMQGRATPGCCRALVLAPTRELAVQIKDNFRVFADGAPVSTALILGGVARSGQVRAVKRGVDVIIATPGRLIDLMDDGVVHLDETRFVVLDEADRMLDMGFVQPVRKIVAALHPKRQSALFSATMPPEVRSLAESFLKDPLRVEVAPQATVIPKIEQRAELLDGPAKRGRLRDILNGEGVERTIVFARTKRGADRLGQNLVRDGIPAEVIHGNKMQNARQKALGKFRQGIVKTLVATDIVARGIDVPGITHVINYDLPDEAENYVHRIGRTGRNGAEGVAITLCAKDELPKLRAVEKIIGTELIPRVAGEPTKAKPRKRPGRPQRSAQPGAGRKPKQAAGDAPPKRNRRRRKPARPSAQAR